MENTENTSAPESSAGAGGAKEKVEKQARQLAYDVRYKTKQAMSAKSGGKLDPAAVRKQYMAQLGKSPANPAVKARAKAMLIGEDYIKVDDLVVDATKNVLNKVFVEGIKEKESDPDWLQDLIVEGEDATYQVRVTDKKTKGSYITKASRSKITQLRANPNISSVEMTKYGEPTRSVAAEKGGSKKKEPVATDEKDEKKKSLASENYDGFLQLVEKSKEKKITGEGVNNNKLIKIFPDEGSDVKEAVAPAQGTPPTAAPQQEEDPQLAQKQKRIGLAKKQILQKKIQAVRQGAGSDITASHEMEGDLVDEAMVVTSADKKGNTPAWQGYKTGKKNPKTGQPVYKAADHVREDSEYGYDKEGKSLNPEDKKKESKKEEEDYRGMKTKVDLVRNKLRAMGLNMSQELEGDELTEEFITERVDHATEYFFNEGINEDGLDLIVEEVGIDEFTAFVIDGPQELNEDDAAYQKAKKKAITGSNRREREGKGEYSPQSKGSKSPYAKEGLGVKSKKKPKIGHTGTKVVAATKKAKKAQPAKPASKEGLGSKIRGFVSKGVERHKAATKKASGEVKKIVKTASDTAKQHAGHRKKFVSGLKATPKERKIAGGIAKGAKRALTGEDFINPDPNLMTIIGDITAKKFTEAKVDTVKGLDDEEKEDARNYRKYGTKHNQFAQAVRRRQEHRVGRGDKKIRGQKPAPKGAYGEEVEIGEEKKDFPTKKVDRKLSSLDKKMASKPYGYKRSDEKNRSMKISGIKDAVKRGEDPRKDTRGGAFAKRGNPDHDHRANYSDNRRTRTVKKAGV